MDQQNQQQKCQLHVRSDSKDSLDALFAINKPSTPGSRPFRERNLPESFFKPPPMQPHHSRSHSAPVVAGGHTFIPKQINNGGGGGSPSTTSQMRQPNQTGTDFMTNQGNHPRGHSVGNVEAPLPPGWEARTTASGQKYFINHPERKTTWDDPRKAHSLTMLNHNSPQQQTPQQQQQSIGPLPDGWEQAMTPEGETYFIDHINKNTSWVDPRLSQQMMGSTSPTPMNNQSIHFMKQQQFMLQQQQLQHQRSNSNTRIDPILPSNSLLASLAPDKYALQMSGGMGIHGRGNSCDSGLDGMGTLLTPVDDSMGGMEDVDMEGNQPLSSQANQDLRLNHNNRLPDCFDSMQGTSVDIGILDNETGLDGINNDMLSGMDMNNMDIPSPLTWL